MRAEYDGVRDDDDDPDEGAAEGTDDGDAAPQAGERLTIVAGRVAAGQRLDRFLAATFSALSRARIKTLIEQGRATRDGKARREPSETVRAGAAYALEIPLPVPAAPQPQAIPLHVLYEDADLIVIDKPAGLVVHPAPGSPDGTLVNALLAHCGDSLPGIGGERRPGIVHRLDKDTSGVMVAAKTEAALAVLGAAFAARDIDRAYVALCWGIPSPPVGDIEGAIGRDPRDRKRMAVVKRGGKAALTRYALRRSWHAGVTLLECRLATGRTHQIRVHLAAAGHPLVGDPVYLRRIPASAGKLPRELRERLLDFPRQALHAARLGFAHPRTGQPMVFETPAPADMSDLVAALDGQAGRG